MTGKKIMLVMDGCPHCAEHEANPPVVDGQPVETKNIDHDTEALAIADRLDIQNLPQMVEVSDDEMCVLDDTDYNVKVKCLKR